MGLRLDKLDPILQQKIMKQLERDGKNTKIEVTWYVVQFIVGVPGKKTELPATRDGDWAGKTAIRFKARHPSATVNVFTYTTMERE